MLTPLVGPAGSGKTTYIIKRVKELAQNGQKVLLIVPEQFSFATEQRVVEELDAKAAMLVEVYSFTRLCFRVFSVCGGVAGQYITEPAKRILMHLALKQVKDQLHIYAKAASSSAFVETMLETVDEFKNAGVDPDQLMEFSAQTGSSLLGQKTEELHEIYKIYQSLLEAKFLDEKDSLRRVCRILEGEPLFGDYEIFIDGFMAFMAGEHQLLEILLRQCKGMTLSFTANSLDLAGNTGENNTFSAVKENALQIISAARRANIPVAAPVYLGEGKRFQSKALAHLEKNIPKTQKEKFLQPVEGLLYREAKNPYEEVRFVAAEICRLVKTGDYRFRDIAIVARSLELYQTGLETVFPQYGIPLFWDRRQDIESVSLISLVEEALEAVRTGFETEHILSLGKNPLLGIPYIDVLSLENYCYLWSINRKQWLAPFQNNPRGLVEGFRPEDQALLETINKTAAAIMQPLLQLQCAIDHATGSQFAQGVYAYLRQAGVQSNMQQLCSGSGLVYEAYRSTNQEAWSVLMDLLDTMYHVLGDIPLPQNDMIDLFFMGLRCADFGEIPNTLDQVTAGTAERMRPNAPKAVFVLGLNQGEFPPQLKEGGIFSDSEREELAQGGIKMNPTVLKRSFYEAFYLYSALTCASHRLYLCSHHSVLNGEITPSALIVSQIKEIFGLGITVAREQADPLFYVTNRATAYDLLCRRYREDNTVVASLEEYVAQEQAQEVARLRSVLEKKQFRLYKKEVAQQLFGNTLRLSPSRVEKYYTCPFAYFCSAGLGLQGRKKVDFSPLQSGSIIHYVLEKMVADNGGKGLAALSEKQLSQQVQEVLQQYLKTRVEQKELLTKRFQYLLRNLTILLTRLLQYIGEELSQSEFIPVGFEVPIASGAQVTPLVCCTADGTEVVVEGVVDRVDILEKEGQRYARVIDYKSGSKEFKLADVYNGLNLQMLIYLFSVWQNGKESFEGVLPGGVLYLQARDHVIEAQRNTPEEQIEAERRKKYKMNGLVLKDPVCIEGMEPKVAGVYIPVKTKTDGSYDSASSLATLSQMGQIQRHISRLLQQMAENLHNGRIEARPVQGNNYEPCKYCDFKNICQHQSDDDFRIMETMSRKEFFTVMEQEQKEGEV